MSGPNPAQLQAAAVPGLKTTNSPASNDATSTIRPVRFAAKVIVSASHRRQQHEALICHAVRQYRR